MKIKYQPKDKSEAPAHTNLGVFQPDETKLIGEDQEAEARRLVANGHFVEVGASKKAPAPELEKKPVKHDK